MAKYKTDNSIANALELPQTCTKALSSQSLTLSWNFIFELEASHICPWLSSDMYYLEALTDNLNRCLMVRGSGKEVVTIFS